MRTALLFLILFFFSWPLEGVHRPAVQPEAFAIEASNFTIGEFVSLSRKEFKKQLGRKMKFKETIGFFLFKKALKRAMKKDPHLADQLFGEYIISNLNRNAEASRTGATPQRPKVDPMALASFSLPLIEWGIQVVIGLVSLLTLASVLLVAGGILGIISLKRIKKNPLKYKGKGWAIAGIMLSSLTILGGLAAGIYVLATFGD